jgi:hypothetical protein
MQTVGRLERAGKIAAAPAAQKKPGCCQPGLGVWERMPERPDLYAATTFISQVRKVQRLLRFLQPPVKRLILRRFYAKCHLRAHPPSQLRAIPVTSIVAVHQRR